MHHVVDGIGAPAAVLVCRGCCCGSDTHPTVDHDRQLEVLRAAVPDGGKLWRVQCLGPCDAANVVVVRSGRRRRWFGRILTEARTDTLARWIATGAPEPLPRPLEALLIDPDAVDLDFGPVDVRPSSVVTLVADLLAAGGGAWSLGVVGATGTWVPDRSAVVETPAPGRFIATGGDGSLALAIDDTVSLYAARRRDGTVAQLVLAAPPVPVNHVITDLGPHGDGRLIDLGLGIGACTFAVRADDGLLSLITPHLGAHWSRLLDAVGDQVVAAWPHVITTGVGRLDRTAAHTTPHDTAAEGSHTHLRASELELGRQLITGLTVPSDLSVGVTFHPPAGWEHPLALQR